MAGPSAAQALTLSNLGAAPVGSTQAGSNTDFKLDVAFDDADVENIRIGLPPGLIGDPGATPQCTQAQLHASTPACPANTQVGTTTVSATVTLIALPVPLTIQGKLYNLVPGPGEPARFGIVLNPIALDPLPPLLPVVLESAVELRKSDFGLDTVINDIPNETSGLPTHINSMSVTLLGNPPGATKPFTRLPTSCGQATTKFTADDYDSDSEVTGTASFTPTGCDQLDFSPAFSASVGAPGLTAAGQKPPLTTVIEQSQEEAGLKHAKVILPPNVGSDLGALGNTCAGADFVAHNCPENSKVGTAVAASPLLTEPLEGPLVLVTADPGPGLPTVGLDLEGQLPLQLMGTFVVGIGTGLEFNGLPDIPIARFALTFDANKLVTNPSTLCDGAPRLFSTEFDGHNGAHQAGSVAGTVVGCTAGGPAPGTGNLGKKAGKCKKKKKKKRKHGRKAASSAKKKKKCKKKRKKRK